MLYPYKQCAHNGRPRLLHLVIAERALGKPLPAGAIVHHMDEDSRNNEPTNLVICPDQAYHMLLHRRARALDECGHADWRKCNFCGRYDAPEAMSFIAASSSAFHRSCRATYERERQRRRRS